MKRANIKFTYHDYTLLPDDKRYEILDGELYVVPSPNTAHQQISLNLEMALYRHIQDKSLGRLFHAPFDVLLSDENVVQPDILFVSKERSGIIGEANIQGAPDLIIEILSKSTKSRDLDIKKKLYAKYGVREYWIVDPAAKSIEVLLWSETGYKTAAVYPHTANLSSTVLPDLRLPPSEIFELEDF